MANREKVQLILDNVHLDDPLRTRMFRVVTFTKNGKWKGLARYHDPFYKNDNENTVARFLGLKRLEVFPIAYDISPWCRGDPRVLVDVIPPEPPASELSIDDWSRLAVPDNGTT
jgi:hypothetical protein